MIQSCIFTLSSIAIYLVSSKKPYRSYGFLMGLISQPFWFYTTIQNEQWGLILLSCFYTFSWSRGVYNYFVPYIKEKRKSNKLENYE